MDQLESFKSHWQQSESTAPRFSSNELQKILAKKSSGIVRWIFYLGIGELLFFLLLGFLLIDGETMSVIKGMGIWTEYIVYSILHYVIILIFIYLFYRNYKRIDTIQPTRTLMKNILIVRRTMNWYVWYNIISAFISFMVGGMYAILADPRLEEMKVNLNNDEKMFKFYAIAIGVFLLLSMVFSVLLWLFYRLLYGILLRKLKRNYKELKRMEV